MAAVERMTADDLGKLLHSLAAKWLEDAGQTQEQLGLGHLQGTGLVKFRWELAFLCMHAILLACASVNPEEKVEAVRTAYLSHFRQTLEGSGMPTTAIAQLINIWNRRYAEYNAAFLNTSDPGPVAHISNVAVENIFGEPKEDIWTVLAVTGFYGPFLQMITEVLEPIEVLD